MDIKLKDLKIKEKITYPIIKYDEKGNETYYENSDGDWHKYEGNKKIAYKNKKYYIDGQEAELIN